ncbi:MAG: XrtA/PEP-CTERM system histidine kinase PrsK [Methylotetracoccus sp.]
MSIGALSYLVGAAAQLFLTVLLTMRRPQSLRARWLILASAVTTTWCVLLAIDEELRAFPSALVWTIELLRDYVWLAFLGKLLGQGESVSYPKRRFGSGSVRLLIQALVIISALAAYLDQPLARWSIPSFQEFGQVTLSIIGLVLVEQFFRNTRPDLRWRIKFLCLALGGMFAYDFYLYTDALLFGSINGDLWSARGAVAGIIVPLIAISAARNPEWNLDLHISRRIVFHSATLLAAGLYLLSMGTIGYYIRELGGAWGPVIQIVFFAAASFALVLLLFSSQLRARVRVFVSKNFFVYAYDYREEWLTLIRTLSDGRSGLSLEERIIYAIGRLVESHSGVLWVRDTSGDLSWRASFGAPGIDATRLERSDPVLTYMVSRGWIVNLTELETMPEAYDGLQRPAWLPESNAWLLLPLFRDDTTLYGVLVLTKPQAPVHWDWEVLDLLKTASRLAASYLALEDAGRQLAEAKQFEGFNRLSAFVIHDLKNLIAQLTLVLRNGERLRDNPEFVQDAFKTLDHVVERMNRLMNQLRNSGPAAALQEVDLGVLIDEVRAARLCQLPRLTVIGIREPLTIMANRDRLFSAFEHVVHNAQDAAGKHGRVTVRVDASEEQRVLIEVEDNGPGMTREFIRTRLFKPFDTTKGLTGMGIGAYESREYVRSLGGDILVRSEPGSGSCFRIALPRASRTRHKLSQAKESA